MADLSILGFAGSLRRGSYNRALLRSAAELAPAGTAIEIFHLSEVPPGCGASSPTNPERRSLQ